MKIRHPRKTRHYPPGYSLVEMIVVIGMFSILLAFIAPSFLNLMPSRKAQIAELSSYLEMARARAIATRQDIFVVFGDEAFPEIEYRCRAYSLFTASGLDEESKSINTRELIQVDPWQFLTADMVFAKGVDFAYRTERPNCVMDSNQKRTFNYTRGSKTFSTDLPYLLFNKNGRVEVPDFKGGELHVGVIEGEYGPQGRVIRQGGDQQVGELLHVSSLTGKITPLDQ